MQNTAQPPPSENRLVHPAESLEVPVTVATFDDANHALKLRERLRATGMDARVKDERTLQRFWFHAKPQAGVHVEVAAEDANCASRCVESWEMQGATERSIRCPSCGSPRIQYPNMTRRFVMPTLVAELLSFFGVLFYECYCEACHHTWDREPDEATEN